MITKLSSQINHALHGSAFLAASLLMGGCSGGAGTSGESSVPTSPRAESTLSGSAIKGVIQQGLVSAYLVENQNGVMIKSETALNTPVRSNTAGAYQINVNSALEDATIVVEIAADAQTRMLCDVTSGCGLDASGNAISFGELFSLSSDFTLQGLVTGVDEGDVVSAHLSPLTHLMVAKASASAQGLTPASIDAAKSYVEDVLDLPAGSLDQTPVDITDLDSQSGVSQAQLEMGVVSAAFLSLVNSPDWDSVDEVLDHVADRLAAGGEMTTVNMGAVRDVALDDVFFEANEIAEDLSALNVGNDYAAGLANVANETQSSYENITTESEQVDPVQITSQPSSQVIDEGETVQFSVGAQGGGSLSFQWRVGGVAIEGANASTLTIQGAELADAGTYDVLVANSVGSVASLSALLQVNEVVVVEPEEPVEQVASIALSWDIPNKREDGSDLELYEINGYVIKYGVTSGNLTESINVVGGGQTEALVEDLETGTYYFAIATVDSDGMQGEFSAEIQETVL